ncbi:MAG TPA: response regulator, partial [Candidatus Thermoplasmatota archaeon]|nr:response regulator [Candidatus Thermoplasmatota archaeon]
MAAVAAQAMREARPTREALVLIVDDDPVFRRFVAAALERASTIRLDAHVVGSLAEAEAVLGSVRYDCVLLDLELPDSQGVETVRRMLAIASDVPVVILTGTEPTDADEDILQA